MKLIVGLSGGVDSSVTAWLLHSQGHDVAAMFMKNWEEDDPSGVCPAEQDAADARQVAQQLGIAFFARNFAAEYWDGVFAHFLDELKAGRTPNPDVLCNREVKFKTFVEHAEDLGYPRIATGHYARRLEQNGQHYLLKARDGNKDQSYFLHAISQRQLARAEFPLGLLEKPQVRVLAEQAKLKTASKKDSTGICFVGERRFPEFIRRFLTPTPGPIRRVQDGATLGEHPGLIFFTLGQRGGIGLGGMRDSNGQPWFVIDKDNASSTLWVSQGEHAGLFSQALTATDATWIAGAPPQQRFTAHAKTRYRQPDQACAVDVFEHGLSVRFAQAQRAMTPGQSVVLYQGDVCLGGAVIDTVDADRRWRKSAP